MQTFKTWNHNRASISNTCIDQNEWTLTMYSILDAGGKHLPSHFVVVIKNGEHVILTDITLPPAFRKSRGVCSTVCAKSGKIGVWTRTWTHQERVVANALAPHDMHRNIRSRANNWGFIFSLQTKDPGSWTELWKKKKEEEHGLVLICSGA